MNVYLPFTPRLPSAYQEVEYIQSSGTQYIDTGYVLTSNPGCDIDFSFLGGDSNSWIPIWGSRNDSYGTNTGNFCLYVNSSSLYVTPNYAGFDPGTSSGLVISSNTKYNIFNDKGQFYIDGIYKSACSTTNTYVSNIPRTFVLFGVNNYDETIQIRGCRMKLYGCKLYNNNVLVRDLVPCYRKSDSVIGLYDIVNNQFYTNSGTGTFSKGNDVTMAELQNAYIGEVYEYSYDFRGKSTTQLSNDGFSVYEGTWKVNASGLSSNSSSARVIVNKSIQSLLNATKLTVTQLCILSNGSVGIRLNGTGRTYATGMYMGTTENYQTLAIAGTANNYSGMSAGTYTQTATFDFVNKTATLSCTGKSDHTETMTDTQIANIKNNINNIEFYIDRNSSYIQTVNIVVEY